MKITELIEDYVAALSDSDYKPSRGNPAYERSITAEDKLASALFQAGPVSYKGWIYVGSTDDWRDIVVCIEERTIRLAEEIEIPDQESPSIHD